MNKRARNRLIGVTAIVLVLVGGMIYYTTSVNPNAAAYYKEVGEVSKDPSLIGKSVQVGGPVVAGSWDKKTNPMQFKISGKGKDADQTINVVFSGTVPTTFGDGTEAIVTGKLTSKDTIQATNLVTKCPSKYESKSGADTVSQLLAEKDKAVGKPVKVRGSLVGEIAPSGTVPRFTVEQGGVRMPVAFDAAIPDGIKAGVEVVLGGTLDKDGVFKATSVATSK